MSGQDVLRERIADTVRAHRPGASIDAYTCDCGVLWTSEHVADAVIAALASVQDRDVSVSTAEGERIARAIWGYLPESCRGHEWCDLCSSEKEYIKIARGYVTPWERIEEDG